MKSKYNNDIKFLPCVGPYWNWVTYNREHAIYFWDFLLQKITFEANLAGLVCGALARAGKWMARAQSIQIL